MTSYQAAGVDLAGAERHIERIAAAVTATWNESVVGSFGGFAAGITIPPGLSDPVLMMTTDGVGTKLELARQTGRWEGVGYDLVAMVIDDLAATGARPIGLVDYMAVGALEAGRDLTIVSSIARACQEAGCPLLGGETAEHPGVMDSDQVDLAATALGLVERRAVLGPERVQEGDVIIGLHSPNLRSNGFSLVRAVFGDADMDEQVGGGTLAEVLLAPSVIYSPAVIAAVATGKVHAACHVTGGGLEANLARVIPPGRTAEIYWDAWEVPAVFSLVAERGGISQEEMRRTFNLGVGFCLVVAQVDADIVIDHTGQQSRVIGRVVAR